MAKSGLILPPQWIVEQNQTLKKHFADMLLRTNITRISASISIGKNGYNYHQPGRAWYTRRKQELLCNLLTIEKR